MVEKPVVHLRWNGQESVREAGEHILRGNDVELELPANLHHALFAHLNPYAEPGEPEDVDFSDDTALLERVAQIRGFEDIAALCDPVSQTHARVRVVSPSPRVIIVT